MGYDIRAWLDREGRPQLRVVDCESGDVRIDWGCGGERSQAIKSLFHELILLSVRDDVHRLAGTGGQR